MFNLKDIRDRKGLSLQALAEALNRKWAAAHPEDPEHFTVDMVFRMEKEPGKIPMEALVAISQVFGMSVDQILQVEAPRLNAPTVTNKRENIEKLRNGITQYIRQHSQDDFAEKHPEIRKGLEEFGRMMSKKPRIACVGRPDAGKSSTIDMLLGEDILPRNWTPTTSTIVYLKHISDRPEYFGNDLVWVFREKTKACDETCALDVYWDPDRIDDEAYCREWKLTAGNYDLIAQYGVHSGKEGDAVGAIVVFVDSPILYNCDLIDLPGFNPEAILNKGEDATVEDIYDSRDSMMCDRVVQIADGCIYLSIANSFMYGEELAMVETIIRNLPWIEKKGENRIPPLGNLFIVASQALTVDHGNQESLDRIRRNAAKRIWKMICDHPAIGTREEQTGWEYSEDTVYSRIFTSEIDSEELTARFYSELAEFTEMLPEEQEKDLWRKLQFFHDGNIENLKGLIGQNDRIMRNHEEAIEQLRLMEENEPKRVREFKNNERRVTKQIESMRICSEKEVSRVYDEVICADNVKSTIERNELKKNKKDMQQLISLLNAQLENGAVSVLTKQSRRLQKVIEEYLQDCKISFASGFSARPDIEGMPFAFNIGRSFAGGLTGLAAYGALAAWAAAYGNLGGYILVAKAVSELASMGIHLGGTAVVISAVSSIGGPVVLGIAIASAAMISAILLLGGSWKKVIGNKVVKQYEKQNVKDKLLGISAEFWDDTLTAFQKGVDNIEAEWQKKMKDHKKKVEAFDEELLMAEKEDAEKAIEFVQGLFEFAGSMLNIAAEKE